jgi:hypothetical protein
MEIVASPSITDNIDLLFIIGDYYKSNNKLTLDLSCGEW